MSSAAVLEDDFVRSALARRARRRIGRRRFLIDVGAMVGSTVATAGISAAAGKVASSLREPAPPTSGDPSDYAIRPRMLLRPGAWLVPQHLDLAQRGIDRAQVILATSDAGRSRRWRIRPIGVEPLVVRSSAAESREEVAAGFGSYHELDDVVEQLHHHRGEVTTAVRQLGIYVAVPKPAFPSVTGAAAVDYGTAVVILTDRVPGEDDDPSTLADELAVRVDHELLHLAGAVWQCGGDPGGHVSDQRDVMHPSSGAGTTIDVDGRYFDHGCHPAAFDRWLAGPAEVERVMQQTYRSAARRWGVLKTGAYCNADGAWVQQWERGAALLGRDGRVELLTGRALQRFRSQQRSRPAELRRAPGGEASLRR